VKDDLAWKRLSRYRDRFVAIHDSGDFGGMADLAAELIECLDDSLSSETALLGAHPEKRAIPALEKRIEKIELAIESMYRKPNKSPFTRRKR
jgi:hypothetical protein